MDRTRDRKRTLLVCLLLTAAIVAVYEQVFRHEFIIYDDGQYIVDNPHVAGGLSWANICWAFTSTYASNWHPLTWISHMLDVQFFGLKPGWHHLVSLALHTANSLLLFLLLKRITGAFWRSAVVAAFFALHPLHVESVAWAAERKDVLSGLFFMMTLIAYAKYVSAKEYQVSGVRCQVARSDGRATRPVSQGSSFIIHHSSFWYCLALGLFALGLMSKPMLVTLPFVLLLLDYWPLGFRNSDFGLRNTLRTSDSDIPTPPSALRIPHSAFEKLPFFALSAASSAITVFAQHAGGSMESLEHVPLEARLSNALVAYWAYLEKMLWPSRLAIIYPRPDDWPLEQVGLAGLVLLASTSLLLWLAVGRGKRYLSVGWLWYIGTLVPVIGLVQVGNQFMADRYTYIPYIGCFIAGVWGARELAQYCRIRPGTLAFLTLVLLTATGIITRRQLVSWKNSVTVFEHCLAVTGDNNIAHNNLGAALAKRGRLDEARVHFEAALRLRPGDADTLHNLGVLLLKQGRFDDATSRLQEAASVKPELAPDYAKLGLILDSEGKAEMAIACYREHLRAKPDDVEVCNNLAWLLATYPEARLRDGKEAVRLAEHACALTGYQKTLLVGTLAAAYAEAGWFEDAVTTAGKAIALAINGGQEELANRNRELLELYRAGKPYHESPEAPKR